MDRDLRTKACLMEQKHYAKHFRKKYIYTSQIKKKSDQRFSKNTGFFFICVFNFAHFLDKSCFGT